MRENEKIPVKIVYSNCDFRHVRSSMQAVKKYIDALGYEIAEYYEYLIVVHVYEIKYNVYVQITIYDGDETVSVKSFKVE